MTSPISRRPVFATAALAAALVAVTGCTASDADISSDLASAVDEAIADTGLDGGGWGILAVDRGSGEVVYERGSTLPLVPGSIQKSFTTAAALDILGAASTITTPVYAAGGVTDGTVEGDLVLVGRGDFSFGLRDQPDGTLEITSFDHNEANTGLLPVGLNTGDPLAALRSLADQLVEAGVTTVSGGIAVDDTYFEPETAWPDGRIDSIWVNENLIDVVLEPAGVGETAGVRVIPQLASLTVENDVETVAGDEVDVVVEQVGDEVVVSGSIGVDAGETVRNTQVDDPVAFAAMAFADVLAEAGIEVQGEAGVPVPAYAGDPVATWESAPISEFARVVQKMSYNRGADLLACLIGVQEGGSTCTAGLAAVLEHAGRLGVPTDEVRLFDAAGSNDYNRTSAHAQVELMKAAADGDHGSIFVDIQPLAGVDGSLSGTGAGTDAEGMIQAKTGTRVVFYPTTDQLFVLAQAYSGYMTTASGRDLVFAVIFNSALVDTVPEVLEASERVASVMLTLQREG
ncbi:D-alanyl-D-alanine carboxypeptidase/D-alanyl-D-alanine endopeptidase [Microbacterium aquimaris]|uniref:D-alanyl-D-alanine carboxypeptidase/D-alanyl-D-alanine-endopeptidase n=1 Tax=Microbacterium aquimaris TaxID=459816 RepID=A0ABU5N3M3_9MICO|nr:D-alanyl-D-alanine carboxypeptidase/D-alanyl-D-alanine-endopeptidase [Microbacterium aquimaris]MDZ8160656.1 D-alanyl-D-alanine carboxypeptidase/D-alanyl-D-alanine-endopeptidase [Microbacterium aquimaris]